jgi:hypothetical protein
MTSITFDDLQYALTEQKKDITKQLLADLKDQPVDATRISLEK